MNGTRLMVTLYQRWVLLSHGTVGGSGGDGGWVGGGGWEQSGGMVMPKVEPYSASSESKSTPI